MTKSLALRISAPADGYEDYVHGVVRKPSSASTG